MPRELVRAPGHDRERSLGHLALWWIETLCVHGPGDVEGDPVELDDEFAGYVLDVYALEPSGRRHYDSAFLSRPKGRAKSELAAFVALYEAFGACRFAGWARGGEVYEFRGHRYVYEPGEPLGRPVVYPYIRCLATEEGQAGNTFDNIYYNLTEGPLGEGLPRDAAGLTRVLLPHGGEIVPSTAANASKDGGKESHVVFDETHLYTLDGLRQMYRTVRRNLTKRREAEGWSHETSTMYAPGEDSVAEATHKLARDIARGKVRRPRTLFDHVEAPQLTPEQLADEATLVAALREVYGPFADVMDLDRLVSDIWDPRNPVNDSRRYFLNQRTSTEDAWLTHVEVAAAADATQVVADRETVTLGFDGSRGRAATDARGRPRGVADSTVLVGCRVSDGHLFLVDAWEQPPGPDGHGWTPPEHLVDAAVRAAFARYRVVGFFADPAEWSERVARWEADLGARLEVKRTPANPIRWKTNQHTAWAEALKALRDALVTGVTFDGADVLVRHLTNARTRPTRSGVTIAKEHPDSPSKIDGAVAATYAYAARLQAVAQGLGARRPNRKYAPRRLR